MQKGLAATVRDVEHLQPHVYDATITNPIDNAVIWSGKTKSGAETLRKAGCPRPYVYLSLEEHSSSRRPWRRVRGCSW